MTSRNSTLSSTTLLVLAGMGMGCSGSGGGAGTVTAAEPPAASSFASFEPSPSTPIAVSADGLRLYAVHPAAGSLAVFTLADPTAPVLMGEVRVGLGPVAVAERSTGEVWVANQLSDSISVVDVESLAVVATLQTGDQPSDLVFAQGRAFVTAATEDRVEVFDAATRAAVGAVDIPAEEPRALAVGDGGQTVWVLSRRSGNGTTILPWFKAPDPPLPTDPDLPLAPRTGLIVRADDPDWSSELTYSLPDADLFRLDAGSLSLVGEVREVGTTLFDLAVDPVGGAVFVAGTEADNLVAHEPNLRARAVEHRITDVDVATGAVVGVLDLNAGVETEILPDPASLAVALAEPTGLAFDGVARRLYVAAQGTDRIGVIDVDGGGIVDRIDLAEAGDETADRRGPRALVLHPTAPQLYVFNHLSHTLTVIDRSTSAVQLELPLATRDPLPAELRVGRKFLYDARLSGNGTMSCSTCHVDAETDGLAWDLGDPAGELFEVPLALQQGSIPGVAPDDFPLLHPMKGPLVTQSLRGLGEPLHWRGDKPTFEDFAGAFDSLMGGPVPAPEDMALFADWARSLRHPPNPHQPLDRSLADGPPGASPTTGFELFHALPPSGLACVSCHTLPAATSGFISKLENVSPQPMRVAPLLDYYRKDGFDTEATGPLKLGFGRFSDGRVGKLVELAGVQPIFAPQAGGSPHVDAFLRQLDSGTAPAVGRQTDLDQGTVADPDAAAIRATLEARALLGELELVAHGTVFYEYGALWFDAELERWIPDRASDPSLTTAQLEALAAAGVLALTWTAVPPEGGVTASIDTDLDGLLDGDAGAVIYGAPSPAACADVPTLGASAIAKAGQELFALVVRDLQPGSAGRVLLSTSEGAGPTPVDGLQVLVALSPSPTEIALVADARGEAALALPLIDASIAAGAILTCQAFWPSSCPGGVAASAGLAITVWE